MLAKMYLKHSQTQEKTERFELSKVGYSLKSTLKMSHHINVFMNITDYHKDILSAIALNI